MTHSGAVTRSFGQLPFGETWYENAGTDKWKFTTYERDGETGFDYAMNRYYNSGFGRFMTVDLLGGRIRNPQSLNRYAYVTNNPVNFVDPLGLDLFLVTTDIECTIFSEGGKVTDVDCEVVNTSITDLGGSDGTGGGGGGGNGGKPLPGVNKVKNILNGKSPCAQFFQQGAKSFLGADTPSASDLFGSDSIVKDKDGPAKLTKSADGNTISQPYAAKTSEGTGANSTIDLNPNGAFFNSTAFFANSMGSGSPATGDLTIGGSDNPRQYAGGSIQAQATILLHEFAHTINLIPSDGGDATQSLKNTQTILDHCKDEIDKLKK